MSLMNKFFGSKKDEPITSYQDFWKWFAGKAAGFHKVVRTNDSAKIEREIFGQLSAALGQVREGYFYLIGMVSDSTADLVLTADGNPKNIVFVEELVDRAPSIPGWQFTKLKQPESGFYMTMNGYEFGPKTLSFYPDNHQDMPDLVDITIVHSDLDDSNTEGIEHGAYIFLDNFLGELNFLTGIDRLSFCRPSEAKSKCIPIEALPNFLETREALFVEKYRGVRINSENDNHSVVEGQTSGGVQWFGIVNEDLMKWDKKASHPWMLVLTIPFGGKDGLPDQQTADKLNDLEDAFMERLKAEDGFLNIGRDAGNNERSVYIACVDFRKPSKVAYELQQEYKNITPFNYDIFKDKYWQSVSHFQRRGEN